MNSVDVIKTSNNQGAVLIKYRTREMFTKSITIPFSVNEDKKAILELTEDEIRDIASLLSLLLNK